MIKFNRYWFVYLAVLIVVTTFAGFLMWQIKMHKMSFMERIQPAPIKSGFRMDNYWVWGGSMIKEEDTYHLFCSRQPKGNDFPDDYLTKSEIVRATSSSPMGPFEFQEIVIGERDSIYWDSNMAHNPTIHRTKDGFILYYIGSDFTRRSDGWPPYHRTIGYATTEKINGPWTRSDSPIIEQEANNPAAYFEKDGSVKLVFRDAPLRVFIAEADHYSGSYMIKNDNVWPDSKLEDFYLYKHKGNYHLLCEDNVGGVSGHERWGVHLVSKDGVGGWTALEPALAYNHDIRFDDGSVRHCTRRERPQLLIENERVAHLITAVYDGQDSRCQPVALEPPY